MNETVLERACLVLILNYYPWEEEPAFNFHKDHFNWKSVTIVTYCVETIC